MNMADPQLPPPGVRSAVVSSLRDGQVQHTTDWLADEVAVALVFNGLSQAVMMATPADLDDFALGFALTEGLIDSPASLYGCEVQAVEQGLEIRLEVSARCFDALKTRRRTLAGRTGCGLCGVESLAAARRPVTKVASACCRLMAEKM